MIFDAEQLLDTLFAIMKAELNPQLEKIQAEKDTLLGTDNFELDLINDDAWFDTLDDKVSNFNPYIYYGINDDSVIEIASAESSDLTIFFTVVLDVDGNDVQMYRKMLRYIRGMRQVSKKHFGDIPEASNFTVTSVMPRDLKDLDLETLHKIGGVSIQTAIS